MICGFAFLLSYTCKFCKQQEIGCPALHGAYMAGVKSKEVLSIIVKDKSYRFQLNDEVQGYTLFVEFDL